MKFRGEEGSSMSQVPVARGSSLLNELEEEESSGVQTVSQVRASRFKWALIRFLRSVTTFFY